MKQFHKVYDLAEIYLQAAETNNRTISDKATAATIVYWFCMLISFVYGLHGSGNRLFSTVIESAILG